MIILFDVFGEKVYNSVIRWGIEHYKKECGTKLETDCKERCLHFDDEFYKKMTKEEKENFYCFLELVMINTASHILGLIDGSTSLNGGGAFESKIVIDGEDMTCELQDSFLVYVEEQKEWMKYNSLEI